MDDITELKKLFSEDSSDLSTQVLQILTDYLNENRTIVGHLSFVAAISLITVQGINLMFKPEKYDEAFEFWSSTTKSLLDILKQKQKELQNGGEQ